MRDVGVLFTLPSQSKAPKSFTEILESVRYSTVTFIPGLEQGRAHCRQEHRLGTISQLYGGGGGRGGRLVFLDDFGLTEILLDSAENDPVSLLPTHPLLSSEKAAVPSLSLTHTLSHHINPDRKDSSCSVPPLPI